MFEKKHSIESKLKMSLANDLDYNLIKNIY
jgi:hypothetical protein